jgi:hypothetical protein
MTATVNEEFHYFNAVYFKKNLRKEWALSQVTNIFLCKVVLFSLAFIAVHSIKEIKSVARQIDLAS